jgi:hypothetical protein
MQAVGQEAFLPALRVRLVRQRVIERFVNVDHGSLSLRRVATLEPSLWRLPRVRYRRSDSAGLAALDRVRQALLAFACARLSLPLSSRGHLARSHFLGTEHASSQSQEASSRGLGEVRVPRARRACCTST